MKRNRTTPKMMADKMMIMFNNDAWYAYEYALNELNYAENERDYDFWHDVKEKLLTIDPTCSRINH